MKNLVIGQSGGPTAVINASLYGAVKAFRESGADGHVLGMINGIEGFLADHVMDLSTDLSDKELELLKLTPAAYLGSCRYKLPADLDSEVYPAIFDNFREMNIGYFLYVGGNDSMDTVDKLSRYAEKIGSDVKFIGIPKTIDNDLVLTDHTPGFGSAAKYVASTVREIVLDASVYQQRSVTIVEIMGRNAGWLVGAAALSKGEDCDGPDLIYVPELPFDIDNFLVRIKELLAEKTFVVVAVSEGIRLADGRYVCELTDGVDFVDAFGHKQLTGTANYLARRLAQEIGCKTRTIELSSMQRAASHLASRIDILEAFQVGGAAVKAADEGDTGEMVIIKRLSDDPYQSTTDLRNVHKVSNVEKVVPREWITEDGTYVTDEFISYVRPLIQGDVSPVMVDGIPRYLYHKKK